MKKHKYYLIHGVETEFKYYSDKFFLGITGVSLLDALEEGTFGLVGYLSDERLNYCYAFKSEEEFNKFIIMYT